MENVGFFSTHKYLCRFQSQSIFFLPVPRIRTRRDGTTLTAAIQNAKTPTKKEVRSFLWMLNYYAPFIQNLSTLTKPLRTVTEEKSEFVWSQECQETLVKCIQKFYQI